MPPRVGAWVMVFLRTALIIAALVLGWFALKAESSAHGFVPPTVASAR